MPAFSDPRIFSFMAWPTARVFVRGGGSCNAILRHHDTSQLRSGLSTGQEFTVRIEEKLLGSYWNDATRKRRAHLRLKVFDRMSLNNSVGMVD